MSNKQLLIDKADALRRDFERDHAALMAEINNEGPWVPQMGDMCWSFAYPASPAGVISWGAWSNVESLARDGLAFRTREEAEHALTVVKSTNFKPYPPMGTPMDSLGAFSWRYEDPIWEEVGAWRGTDWQKQKWHCGQLRVRT